MQHSHKVGGFSLGLHFGETVEVPFVRDGKGCFDENPPLVADIGRFRRVVGISTVDDGANEARLFIWLAWFPLFFEVGVVSS